LSSDQPAGSSLNEWSSAQKQDLPHKALLAIAADGKMWLAVGGHYFARKKPFRITRNGIFQPGIGLAA
jgi:hypothetical protein